MNRNTGVPVGLIGAYWSGTNIWSWTNRDSLSPCNYTLPVGGMRREKEGKGKGRGRGTGRASEGQVKGKGTKRHHIVMR